MGDAPAATRPGKAIGWVCLGVVFALGLLLAIDPVAFGAGLGVVIILGVSCGVAADRAVEAKKLKRQWILSGPSPLRQEITFLAPGKCSIGFWFMGNQSMSYRYDVTDAEGNDVPEGVHVHDAQPAHFCWVQDEGGPGGTIYVPDRVGGTTVTVRYYLQATDDKTVRRTELTVRVGPGDAGVQIPERPTPLHDPVVRWGRIGTPDEQLKTLPSAPAGS